VRLSVKLTTVFSDPRQDETELGSSTLPSDQLCLGAPRSHQRTWVNQDGAKPHQSSVSFSFPSSLMMTDGVFLLREPHAVHQRHGSKREIRGSAVERPAVFSPHPLEVPELFLRHGLRAGTRRLALQRAAYQVTRAQTHCQRQGQHNTAKQDPERQVHNSGSDR
jgi:hypothetical protein